MKCGQCKFWGSGDGTGYPYDAGHMNYCNHPQIDGQQHPSFGACNDLKTMIYVEGRATQFVKTRIDFGCILFIQRAK